jgi:hypothetical protein
MFTNRRGTVTTLARNGEVCKQCLPKSDPAALKVLYLVIRTPRPNRANVTGQTTGWKKALNALAMYYDERITEN